MFRSNLYSSEVPESSEASTGNPEVTEPIDGSDLETTVKSDDLDMTSYQDYSKEEEEKGEEEVDTTDGATTATPELTTDPSDFLTMPPNALTAPPSYGDGASQELRNTDKMKLVDEDEEGADAENLEGESEGTWSIF